MTTRYKVIGPNSVNGRVECWHFSTRKEADAFAESTAGDLGNEYQVAEVVGVWRRTPQPVEFVPEEDSDGV